MTQFLDEQGLARYDSNLKSIVGGDIKIEGQTVSLVSVSGEVIGGFDIPQGENPLASANNDGLMPKEFYIKVEGIQTGATKTEGSSTNGKIIINGAETNVYIHPTNAKLSAGFYKISTDEHGHVTVGTAITKADIVALGIPAQDTTYGAVTSSKNGLMTSSDFTKLGGIATGAQVNVLEKVSVNGTALTINSKGVNIDLSGYALKSDVASAIDLKGSVDNYSDLPSSPEKGDMYNIVNADETHGIKAGDNVVWDGTKWDNFGGVFTVSSIPLSEIDALFA